MHPAPEVWSMPFPQDTNAHFSGFPVKLGMTMVETQSAGSGGPSHSGGTALSFLRTRESRRDVATLQDCSG
jgi:hypothetical protein